MNPSEHLSILFAEHLFDDLLRQKVLLSVLQGFGVDTPPLSTLYVGQQGNPSLLRPKVTGWPVFEIMSTSLIAFVAVFRPYDPT
jgi:hypothetical protein